MDIVVTIPKSEYANDDKETSDTQIHGYDQFWTLSKVPKRLNIGDRVYFVKHGRIDSSMRVKRIQAQSQTQCETTGRTWNGVQLFMNDMRDEDIGSAKGFQGFRYKWWR
jgi:hypothetical protein